MVEIVGIDLETACQPGVLWRDTTGPTGVLTLTCGGSFSNATGQTLICWVQTEYPDRRQRSRQIRWVLPPGSTAVSFPDPPEGAMWILATQTAFQRNYGVALAAVGAAGVLALASYGAEQLVAHRIHRRRG